jgi:hypothetical protein
VRGAQPVQARRHRHGQNELATLVLRLDRDLVELAASEVYVREVGRCGPGLTLDRFEVREVQAVFVGHEVGADADIEIELGHGLRLICTGPWC